MPRRYPNYPAEFQIYNVMSTAGASVLGLGYLIPAFYLTLSLFYGKKAGPTRGARPAWSGPDAQPAAVFNFDESNMPVVVCGPYEYAMGSIRWAAGCPKPPGPCGAATRRARPARPAPTAP